ncbi:MAG: response regulator [Nitrosomonadales bacterium]|jgi:twitching motility two-component system response regulator PilH|nr:MAG: response regulator [Nitrosomonadales bacterium]
MAIENILVVDDSPTERYMLLEILTKSGYKVLTAASGEEVIAMTKEIMPDLILMDVVMPGQDGFNATRAISRGATTKHIPIVICSTKGQETDKIWGMRQGAKGYLVKPIRATELLKIITELG